MTINWSNTKIGIIGAGISGIAAAKLGKHMGADIFISDYNETPEILSRLASYEHEIGGHSDKILDSDLIIISPGVSDSIQIIQNCMSKDIPIISEIEFASWFTTSPILALTGSNGKTTTVNLLHEMCLSYGKNSLLGGNVGIPFSENVLWEIKSAMKDAVHVLELSSFQLEHIHSFSPKIAGLLNISEDHMDRYDNIHDYMNAKIRITKCMTSSGCVVYNGDDPMLLKALDQQKGAKLFSMNDDREHHFKLNASKIYSGSSNDPDILFKFDESSLKGIHNIQNILAASTMAHIFGISDDAIRDTIINFKPIPNRFEWIGNIDDVDYINDSKATNIAATRAAIESLDKSTILIMGGTDKGNTNFSKLGPLLDKHIKYVITYGEAGQCIKDQIDSIINVIYVEKFDSAILKASEKAQPNDIILLSPACSSFDQFNNYEERGDAFKNIFNNLELNL